MRIQDYQKKVYNVLNESRNRSTEIYLEERYGPKHSYGGVFQQSILDDEEISETKDNFIRKPGEKVLIKIDKIKWVENVSVGTLTLTDQRIFYTPQYYDAPQTTKNLEINLDRVNSVGLFKLGAVSAVVMFVGDKNIRIEFTSPIPFKLIKMWKALKHINKDWKILRG